MAELGFPKDSRLQTSADYKAVFQNAGYKVSCRYFLMLAKNNNMARGRLGMVIAKKNVAKAVHRNRIKRLIRYSFRHAAQQLSGLDIIVLARRDADSLSNTKVMHKLNSLWADLQSKAARQLAAVHQQGRSFND